MPVRACRVLLLLALLSYAAGCATSSGAVVLPPRANPQAAPPTPAPPPAPPARAAQRPAAPAAASPPAPVASGPAANAVTAPGRGVASAAVLGAASAALLESSRRHVRAGELDAAAEDVERALTAEPNQPRLWLELAEIRARQGRGDQARTLVRRAQASGPMDAATQARAEALLRRLGG